MKLQHLTFSILAAVALAGCSGSSSAKMPPDIAIANSVNTTLSEKIDRAPNDVVGKLFVSFKVTKDTLETRDNAKVHVIEFEALCPVRPIVGDKPESGASWRHAILGDEDTPENQGVPVETQKFTGKFTLAKNGDFWLLQKPAQ